MIQRLIKATTSSHTAVNAESILHKTVGESDPRLRIENPIYPGKVGCAAGCVLRGGLALVLGKAALKVLLEGGRESWPRPSARPCCEQWPSAARTLSVQIFGQQVVFRAWCSVKLRGGGLPVILPAFGEQPQECGVLTGAQMGQKVATSSGWHANGVGPSSLAHIPRRRARSPL